MVVVLYIILGKREKNKGKRKKINSSMIYGGVKANVKPMLRLFIS